ncbi:unnamed protein product [Heligmosomoides polygyrus]|uniref:C2H2-type domain-containing protein n=1 Tax=Heligmosomoides polygyrus TaxID=6339 RepID=A0A183GLM4_HELPZ|nr:unnamed protein product [Heligmosomoides polygyrus]
MCFHPGYRLVSKENARALTAQQQAEPLCKMRKDPMSSKKRKDVAEVAHRMDVTPDPNTGVQLADCVNSNGSLLESASDRKSVRYAGAHSSTAARWTNRAEASGQSS